MEKQYASEFKISSSPHLRGKGSVPKIMYWVVGVLMLPVASSIYFFGMNAIRILLISIIVSLFTEYIFLVSRKKDISSLFDGSAIITGILLALTLPPGLKSSYVAIGAFVAIALGKQVFGGLGYNMFNPALVGRAFLQASFPVAMTTWIPPVIQKVVDAKTFATPLGGFKFSHILTPYKNLFIGNTGGSLGETSAILLIIGGLILLIKKYIDWKIPTGILLTVFVLEGGLYLINPEKYANPLFYILSGGLLLGAFFMATDMVTSPITPKGTWIYAISIGILVVLIRVFGGLPEGVMYSILIINGFVPLLNRYTRPRILGERGKK
jgi:electron transport complex protein RnfD